MFPQRSSSIQAGRPRMLARLLRVACVAAPFALGACSSVETQKLVAAAPSFFDDAGFAPSTEPIDPSTVFTMTPEMQAYVDKEVLPIARTKGLRTASPTRCTRAASCSSSTRPR